MSAACGKSSIRTLACGFSCGSRGLRLGRVCPRRMQSELFRPGYEGVKVARRNVAFLLQSHDFSYSWRPPVRSPHQEAFRGAGVIARRYSVCGHRNMAAKSMTEILFDLSAESFRLVSPGFPFVFCRVTGTEGRERRTGTAP
jgi:hypothetical protein